MVLLQRKVLSFPRIQMGSKIFQVGGGGSNFFPGGSKC